MGKIKKILENELVGGTQTTDVYPVTSVKAVYDENNERLDHILNRRGVVNISTNYNDDHIAEVLTLKQAIAKVPSDDRVLGFTMTFLSSDGWKTYQFTGDSVSSWSDIGNWDSLFHSSEIQQELGNSQQFPVSQYALTKKLRASAALSSSLWNRISYSDDDFIVGEKYTDSSTGIDCVDVTIPNIAAATLLDPATGSYPAKEISNISIKCPHHYGVIALVGDGSSTFNIIAYSLDQADTTKELGRANVLQKYENTYNIIPIIYISYGSMIFNALTQYANNKKLQEFIKSKKILTISSFTPTVSVSEDTVTISQGVTTYLETTRYDNINTTTLSLEGFSKESRAYLSLVIEKDTLTSTGVYKIISTHAGTDKGFQEGKYYAVIGKIVTNDILISVPYKISEYIENLIMQEGGFIGDIEVTDAGIRTVLLTANAGDEVNITMSGTASISLLGITVNGDIGTEKLFWSAFTPNTNYNIVHRMETSGNIVLWTSSANIITAGTINVSSNKKGRIPALEAKTSALEAKKADVDTSFSMSGPAITYEIPQSVEFSNIEGVSDAATCTVTYNHDIILCPVSKSHVPKKIDVFEKAPYNYGAIVAVFDKRGTRHFKELRVITIGANRSTENAIINPNEITIPLVAWIRGKVVYSFTDVEDLKNRVLALENSGGKVADVFIMPPAIYTTCNDIDWHRNYSLKLYIDHCFAKLSNRPNVKFSNGSNFKTFYSKYNSYQNYINSTTPNTTEDVRVVTITDTLSNTKSFSTVHRSIRNKATSSKVVRLLCIGDSVTQGIGAEKGMPYSNSPKQYWSWVKALFEMDNINAGEGYFFESLGNLLGSSHSGYSFDITDLSGISKSGIKAFACGVGGSRTSDWVAKNLNNGVTNPFYNTSTGKFSLKYWVENYRTLIVKEDGTTERCTSENKGILAPTDTTQYNVCEPTHVLIQLGYNQQYSGEGATRTNYIDNLQEIISTIQSEYPDVYILLSLPDTAGTYYPELFPEYVGEGDDIYPLDFIKGSAKSSHDNFAYMNKDLIALADENNKVYYAPTYFASPLCYGATVRDIPEVSYLASKDDGNKGFIHEGSLPNLHPSCVAHANWAYQIYSLIKYTLLNG